jgi:hypothetical protein
MIFVDLDAAEFPAELFAEFGIPVGNRDQTGIGDALRQVARIDAAQPSQSNHTYIQET